jgi:hypothetical protein
MRFRRATGHIEGNEGKTVYSIRHDEERKWERTWALGEPAHRNEKHEGNIRTTSAESRILGHDGSIFLPLKATARISSDEAAAPHWARDQLTLSATSRLMISASEVVA